MNLKTHIDALKQLMHGGIPSDDRRLSDGFLSHILFAVRNDLLRKRLDKGTQLSEEVYNTICMDVSDSKFHNCNCAEGGCDVKRSVFKIPSVLMTKRGATLKVMNLNGEVIDSLSIDTNKYAKEHGLVQRTRSSNIFDISQMNWYTHNNYIFVQNNPHIKKILVKGVFTESIANLNLEQCTGLNNNTTTCVYPYSDSGFIDQDLLPVLYSMCLQLINRPVQDKASDEVDATITPVEGMNSSQQQRRR
jgi:hypothetical protein